MSRGWFWIVLVILLVVGSRYLFNGTADSADQVGLNVLADQIQEGKVKSMVVQGETVTIVPTEGSRSYTRKEEDESLFDTLACTWRQPGAAGKTADRRSRVRPTPAHCLAG